MSDKGYADLTVSYNSLLTASSIRVVQQDELPTLLGYKLTTTDLAKALKG